MNLELFEKSRELGELLVKSEEYVKVQETETAFNEDEFAKAKVDEFNELQKAVQQMMQTPDPDQAAIAAAADRLRNMQAELVEMPSIKAMNDAQAAFSNLLTQVFHRKFPEINTVQCYASLRHIIQTRNQIHDRRFSTTGTSDDRRSLPRISSEVNVVNRRLPAARICEIYMVKFQHTL